MENDDWNWKSKLTVYTVIIVMILTVFLYIKGCATGELFNSPSPKRSNDETNGERSINFYIITYNLFQIKH